MYTYLSTTDRNTSAACCPQLRRNLIRAALLASLAFLDDDKLNLYYSPDLHFIRSHALRIPKRGTVCLNTILDDLCICLCRTETSKY